MSMNASLSFARRRVLQRITTFSSSFSRGRRPLVLARSASSSTSKTTTTGASQETKQPSRFKEAWSNGNILIALGWAGVALIVVDRYLQYADRKDADQMVGFIQDEQNVKRKELFEKSKDKPALFQCIVRTEYKGMGGTHGLKGIELNERLDILEEGVGPGGYYNLCRRNDKDGKPLAIGWYPIGFLEKVSSKRK